MRPRIRLLGAAFVTTVVVAVGPPGAAAQQTGSFILTPYAAIYAPTASVMGVRTRDQGLALGVSGRHNPALALGANGSYWFTHRLGLEVGGAYAWSDLKFRGELASGSEVLVENERHDGYVVLANAKAMINLVPAGSLYNLRLGVGPAVIHRGGAAYHDEAIGKLTDRTDLGAAVSLCSRFGVSRDVFLRLRAESYLYDARLSYEDPADPTNNFRFDRRFQNDLLISAGVQYTFR